MDKETNCLAIMKINNVKFKVLQSRKSLTKSLQEATAIQTEKVNLEFQSLVSGLFRHQ